MPGDHPHPEIYEPLSHTGDLGMIVHGRDLPELFAHAAWAMFDLMSEHRSPGPRGTASFSLGQMPLYTLTTESIMMTTGSLHTHLTHPGIRTSPIIFR